MMRSAPSISTDLSRIQNLSIRKARERASPMVPFCIRFSHVGCSASDFSAMSRLLRFCWSYPSCGRCGKSVIQAVESDFMPVDSDFHVWIQAQLAKRSLGFLKLLFGNAPVGCSLEGHMQF